MQNNIFDTQEKIDKHQTHCKNISDSMGNYFSFIRECTIEQLMQQNELVNKAKSVEEKIDIVLKAYLIHDTIIKLMNNMEKHFFTTISEIINEVKQTSKIAQDRYIIFLSTFGLSEEEIKKLLQKK